MAKKKIALISTGGTIEKTYCEFQGILRNEVNVLDVLLSSLVLHGVELVRVPLMNKDSLEMGKADHNLIAETAVAMCKAYNGVVIVHGTDKLSQTGERICELIESPLVPVVITGAMRPFELRTSDAVQNITEALTAVQLLPGGVYSAMHNRVLRFPGVIKDKKSGTFIHERDLVI